MEALPSCDCAALVAAAVACGGWELQKWPGLREEACKGSRRRDKSPGKQLHFVYCFARGNSAKEVKDILLNCRTPCGVGRTVRLHTHAPGSAPPNSQWLTPSNAQMENV